MNQKRTFLLFCIAILFTVVACDRGNDDDDRKKLTHFLLFRKCPPLIPPNVRVNYQVRCSRGNSIGSVCQISCSNGLILFGGVSSVTCLKGGIWSRSLSKTRCGFDKRCPLIRARPTAIAYKNATNNASETRLCSICPSRCPYGQVCCPSLKCGSTCVPVRPVHLVQCPALNLNYVKLSCSRGTNVGSVCTVGCREGYKLIGGSKLTCSYSGQWTPKYFRPRCVPYLRQCPALSAIDYTVRCTDGTNYKSVCQVVCPPGKQPQRLSRVTCRYGKWLPSPKLIRCVADPRCPQVNPLIDNIPVQCTVCQTPCPDRHICCPTSCGSTCTPLPTITPVRRCPSPFKYKYRPSFGLTCSSGFNVGSRCEVTCPPGTVLSGVATINCLKNAQWNQDLSTTQCIPEIVCPPGVPQAKCFASPCQFVTCPGEPDATCVDNFCNGCNFDFFLNGRKLSRRQCFPKKNCPTVYGRPRKICKNICPYARCSSLPRAICQTDCDCSPIFYHPITYKEVTCDRVIFTRNNRDEDDEEDVDEQNGDDRDDNDDDDDADGEQNNPEQVDNNENDDDDDNNDDNQNNPNPDENKTDDEDDDQNEEDENDQENNEGDDQDSDHDEKENDSTGDDDNEVDEPKIPSYN